MEVIVPLISSSVRGPLGACHLPRLWLKILLHAAGRLPEGYRHGSGGFDELTLNDLGIDPQAFIAYVEGEMPTYLACEAWVRANASNLGADAIAAHNEKLANHDKPAGAAAELRAALGIDPSVVKAIALNDIDDWSAAHAAILAAKAPPAS